MSSPHHRLHQQSSRYRNSISPTSTCSDEDSSHSQPNDLTLSGNSRKHHNPSATFPGYPSFYSPPHHNSLGQSQHGSTPQPNSPYIATNECRIIEYRGARIAAFLSANKNPCEYLLCLPQAFELFLKHLVGGLHTVYTKLKRLDIVPIVCNVEQVRILRGLGAIQPGVNRCKLLSTKDFDVLFKDCTTARPGRPPKRSPVAGMVSPVPTSIPAAAPQQQTNSVPYLGFPPSGKKPRYADDAEFASESLDIKHQASNQLNGSNNPAATAAAVLAANGYSAAFPFLQHFGGGTSSSQQQQQQLVAAAAALGLPGLPPTTRFPNASPPPGLPTVNSLQNSANTSATIAGTSATNNTNNTNNSNNLSTTELGGSGSDFNPTAAYLWLLSQQQHHHHQQQQQQQQHQQQGSTGSALNLSSRNSLASANNGNNHNANSSSNIGLKSGNQIHADQDETTDDEDEDDVESNNSSNNSDNPVSSTGFNVNGISTVTRSGTETNNHNSHNPSSASPPPCQPNPPHIPPSASGAQSSGSQPQPEHCLETLLRNIEGLLAIAAHNARQQQSQLHLQKASSPSSSSSSSSSSPASASPFSIKAELRAELANQIEREKELREHLEKQLNEEQKVRVLYQKRFKKERRFRRKLEHELQQVQKVQPNNGNGNQQGQTQQQQQLGQQQQQQCGQQRDGVKSPQSPAQGNQVMEQCAMEVGAD